VVDGGGAAVGGRERRLDADLQLPHQPDATRERGRGAVSAHQVPSGPKHRYGRLAGVGRVRPARRNARVAERVGRVEGMPHHHCVGTGVGAGPELRWRHLVEVAAGVVGRLSGVRKVPALGVLDGRDGRLVDALVAHALLAAAFVALHVHQDARTEGVPEVREVLLREFLGAAAGEVFAGSPQPLLLLLQALHLRTSKPIALYSPPA